MIVYSLRKAIWAGGPLPPSAGFLSREIIHDIEIELQYQDTWEDDEGKSPDTPLGIRAVGVFNQLVSTEWIYLESEATNGVS